MGLCRGYIGIMENKMETVWIIEVVWGYVGVIWDNGKYNGNCDLGLYENNGRTSSAGRLCGFFIGSKWWNGETMIPFQVSSSSRLMQTVCQVLS